VRNTSGVRDIFQPDTCLLAQPHGTMFSELATKTLRRGTLALVRQLNADIRTWIQTSNGSPDPYLWTMTADQILESVGHCCRRINCS
jgi:hypothetical protein